jgi:hypothetical protein
LAADHVSDPDDLEVLIAARIAHTGAGRDAVEAAAPAVLEVPGKGRVLVFSYGSPTSGVPLEWAATAHRPGINFLEDTSKKTARRIAREMRGFNRLGGAIQAGWVWNNEQGSGATLARITTMSRNREQVRPHRRIKAGGPIRLSMRALLQLEALSSLPARLFLYPNNRVFCRLRDAKFDDGLGWNFDFLLRLRIKARTRLPLLLHQLAKTGQDEFAVLFDLFVGEVAERIEEYSRSLFVGLGGYR